MKRLIAMLLTAAMVITLASCGDGKSGLGSNGKTTLMIYMIGSDLESKSGAATDDLIEIQESGIDIDKNNVIVYSGGCGTWQNSTVSAEENTILSLNSDGYTVEKKEALISMGEADTLSGFLNYCTKNHPADHYALILWNHGNGPLIGYGKDTLYDNDSLTLSEMGKALEDSPFGGDIKLDWVGFDACLMASAELSCLWGGYADYLIASQEVEPAFGWNYSFLANLGKKDAKELSGDITQKYLDACLEYFEKKDYKDRDTTLACVDLAYSDELKDAINALFGAARDNVAKQYDSLAALRVGTRALGRASTGSEYDLVDLKDLSIQLSKDYPEQTRTLGDVLDKMIVTNATNGSQLCGMSLYYPFYNKSYYENTWRETYKTMNAFPEYLSYLAEYEKIWLGSDMEEEYATSETPKSESAGKYTLTLTDEQAKHYASAKYYILRKEGKETYSKVYSSSDITYKDGMLSADFDGNVIYAHNDIDDYLLPVTVEHDTVGENTNYSAKVSLNNSQGGSFLYNGAEEVEFKTCRFLIAANKKSGEIAVSALMPYDTDQSGTDLLGGKSEEVDVTKYTTYTFMTEDHRTLTRTDNNVVLPVDEWLPSGDHLWNEWSTADGLEFIYAPLGYGNYSMVFEICDTQGNEYCSEPIDIDTSGVDWLKTKEKETTVVESDGTYPLLLKEDDRLAVYLDKYKDENRDYLTLFVKNKSDKKLRYVTDELVANDKIACTDGNPILASIDAESDGYPMVDLGNTKMPDNYTPKPMDFDFGDALDIGALKELSSMSFDLTVTGYEDKKTLWKKEKIEVRFKDDARYKLEREFTWNDAMLDAELKLINGAEIPAQTLVDENNVKIELLCFGKTSDYSNAEGAFRVTNSAEEGTLFLATDGLAIDDIFINATNQVIVPAGKEAYCKVSCINSDIAITGIQKMAIEFRTAENTTILWQGYGDVNWVDVKLSKKSDAPTKIESGDTALMDQDGVTVKLVSFEETDYNKSWTMTLENKRDEGVRIDYETLKVNGTAYSNPDTAPIFMYRAQTGPGQITYIKVSTSSLMSAMSWKDVKDVALKFVVYDFTGEKILFRTEEDVNLNAE